MNPKRPILRHIIIKVLKVEGENLKSRKIFTYKGTSIRLSLEFSAASLQVTSVWHGTFKVLKGKGKTANKEYSTR